MVKAYSAFSFYLAAMNLESRISILLGSCICLVFLGSIYTFSDNSPFQDDVNYIDFIYHFAQKNQNLPDFLRRLFMVDNNHMALLPKLGISLQFLLFQDIHFKRIILISAFQLCLICAWFLIQFRQLQKPLWMALPLLLAWFQPQYYEIANWAMTGIQQSSVILCSILAIECVAKASRKYFILAIGFAATAFYSFGSGVLAYLGMFYFLVANKRYREIVWIFPPLFLQLASYAYMAQHGSVANASDFHLSHAIPFFLNLVGTMAMVSSVYAAEAAWILGTLYSTLAIFGLLKINHRSKIATLLVMLLANCLLIVSSRDGLGIYMVSRFATLSPLIGMCLYLMFLPVLSKRITQAILVFAALFWMLSYIHYLPALSNQKNQAVAESANWTRNQRWLHVSQQFQQYASPSLIPSYQQGLWTSHNDLLVPENEAKLDQAKDIRIEWITTNATIEIKHFPLPLGLSKPYYFIFQSQASSPKTYFKNIEFQANSKKNLILSGQYFVDQGKISLSNAQMEPGVYQVYLYDALAKRYWNTGKTYTSPKTI